MRIDDNAEALAMMKRALGSLEGKIREAYNKGYQDGVKSMVAEDEPNSSEKPNNCETCKNWDIVNDHCYFIQECRYEPKDDPQTERCPHCGDGVITKGHTTCPICGGHRRKGASDDKVYW